MKTIRKLAHIGSTKRMSSRNVIDPQGISPCLCSAMGLGGGGHIPRIPVIKRIQ